MNLEPRTPGQSATILSQVMELTDANLANNVHGGTIMKLCDAAAGIAAVKHCGARVVTAAMDEMSFIEPVFLGEILTLRAQVNDVGRTSMEVGVRVDAENFVSKRKVHSSSAYLVFVALDEEGKPRPVPPLVAQTEKEQRRQQEAKLRRENRLARKAAIDAVRSKGD